MRRKSIFIAGVLAALSFTTNGLAEISVIFQQDPNTVKWIKEVQEAYNRTHPDKKAKLNVIGGTQADYYTKASLIMRDGKDADVVYEDSFMLKSDINAGTLAPIPADKWDEWKNFFPSLRDSATVDGKVYGIPMSTDTRGLFYNVNYFKDAGIPVPWEPKTWNDILDAARKIKDKCPDVIPFTCNIAANGEGTTMQTFEMLLYGTDDTLYKDGKWVLGSKGFLDSLKFIDTLYKEKLGAPLSLVLNPQYGMKVAFNLAPEQKAAIILDGCWIMGAWKEKFQKTFDNYKFVAMPTENGQAPGKTSMSGGWLMSVNSKSGKQDEAMDFIKFAMNRDNSLKYVKVVGNLTTRMDVEKMGDYPEYMKEATGFINFTHFRPANEQYPMISPFIQKAVEAVATGQLTPEQAAKQYDDSVRKAFPDSVVEIKN